MSKGYRQGDLSGQSATPANPDAGRTLPDGHAHQHAAGEHAHGATRDADARYVSVSLGLIVAFMLAEVVVAIVAKSLVLFADAGHMLTDAGALAASLWAIRLTKRPATARWTFGLFRAEILAAAVNAITLLIVSALITFEAVRRLLHPPEVAGGVVLVVALVGVVVNVAATWVLAKANRSSLNIAGAFAHIVTDLYAFIGTAVAGLIIFLTGFSRADSIASLVVVGLMLHAAWPLLRKSGHVLLQGTPENVNLDDLREHLLETEHVLGVHDLHVWTLTSDQPVLSAHVVIEPKCFTDGHAPQILDSVQHCVAGHFDVEHSTFQLEAAGHTDHEVGAHA